MYTLIFLLTMMFATPTETPAELTEHTQVSEVTEAAPTTWCIGFNSDGTVDQFGMVAPRPGCPCLFFPDAITDNENWYWDLVFEGRYIYVGGQFMDTWNNNQVIPNAVSCS